MSNVIERLPEGVGQATPPPGNVVLTSFQQTAWHTAHHPDSLEWHYAMVRTRRGAEAVALLFNAETTTLAVCSPPLPIPNMCKGKPIYPGH